MKKRIITAMVSIAALVLSSVAGVQAAVADNEVSQAYNSAVKLEDSLDAFDVTVKSVVSIAGQNTNAEKTITIQTIGMTSEDNLQVSIDVQASDGEKQQYYQDGYFYSNQSGKNLKYAMDQESMKELLNYYIYLNFDSEYLSMLESSDNTNGTTYTFAATEETIGNYADHLLEGAQEEHQINIVSLQGTVDVDTNGVIKERQIEMAYMVKSGDNQQLCVLNSDAVFTKTEDVSVQFPDLTSYKEKAESEAAVNITKESQTLYATADVNVRAQNNVTSAVLGGIAAGDTMQETGYTDNGWIQISYNNATAYVSADYVSTEKPVIIKAMSGDMYATSQVNVRDTYSTSGNVLGTLSAGEAIATTGYTDNGWIQVSYNGETAYIDADYLTWDAPEAQSASTASAYSGYVEGYVLDASTNTILLQTSNGSEYEMYTADAVKNSVDGILVGDWIGIYYSYDGSNYVASEVDDYNNHNYSNGNVMNDNNDSGNVMNDDNGNSGYQDMQSYGTVIADGMSAVTVALDNGVTLSAAKDNVSIIGTLYEGAYVLVSYTGDYITSIVGD